MPAHAYTYAYRGQSHLFGVIPAEGVCMTTRDYLGFRLPEPVVHEERSQRFPLLTNSCVAHPTYLLWNLLHPKGVAHRTHSVLRRV